MNYNLLINEIKKKNSFLCVGLDPDKQKLPYKYQGSPESIYDFNKEIIDATRDLCVAYKLNSAFYEVYGATGWKVMKKTMSYIGDEHMKIADAKRGDIGNTSRMYAQAFFEEIKADAITISPYMGTDSVMPFLDFQDKWVIILGLTSNPGSKDFQFLRTKKEFLYEKVLHKIVEWGDKTKVMCVIGATHPDAFKRIREILPHHFFLVPGVGAQGGDLAAVYHKGKTEEGIGLLVNSARSIIYAGGQRDDYIEEVRKAAQNYQKVMERLMNAR